MEKQKSVEAMALKMLMSVLCTQNLHVDDTLLDCSKCTPGQDEPLAFVYEPADLAHVEQRDTANNPISYLCASFFTFYFL